ncbi:dienelactone hydrolase [Actinoplanes sp. SE50]|uniref:dienelactone hydrolase family protein n=1 Tax=unclassified Actinoplanes TaxID=2626549 RepID=UPI00023EE0CC|nr:MULTISPECIES: dienelactone hydrolase family protein [unclassified Actinoplanes]AEV89036.1 carboxymethylenebutenolidase [Actinoplanes sp. SE50/110]ATO87442.1 dienelactone hydrolase [Actinoplanes sp. SE50]SLM04860.1 dienelactone hydrolase [Actinoplanes sp. SE50/110]
MQQTSIDIPAADGPADGYFVKPDGPGPYPGILIFMDGFGVRPRLREMADRIAERGYAVLLPNLLYRDQRSPLVDPAELADPEKRGAAFGRLMPMMQNLTAPRLVADVTAYLDFLAAQEGVAPGPVGAVGYCMGGRNGLIAMSALPDRIKVLGSFHAGRVVTGDEHSPHLGVGAITGEVYFGHADNDASMTPDQIKTLEAALDEAGVTYTSELYEGAPHGYTMSDTAMHHPAGEQRHWAALFDLLDRNF